MVRIGIVSRRWVRVDASKIGGAGKGGDNLSKIISNHGNEGECTDIDPASDKRDNEQIGIRVAVHQQHNSSAKATRSSHRSNALQLFHLRIDIGKPLQELHPLLFQHIPNFVTTLLPLFRRRARIRPRRRGVRYL